MKKNILNPYIELYYGYLEGITAINGQKFHSRINKIISLEVTQKDSLNFIFEIEMFRRSQVTNYMSQAEKDFWNHLAYITDHVIIQTDFYGKPKALLNFDEIYHKKNKIIDELKYSYKGEDVLNVLKSFEENTTNSNCFFKQLLTDDLYGLFFKDIYGQMHKRSIKKKIPYILRNRGLDIEESTTPEEVVDENSNLINLTYSIEGVLITDELEDIEIWKAEAGLLDLRYSQGDKPVLNRYNGLITLNDNNSIQEVDLSLSFSFGDSYKKENNYSLTAITEEEIDEDLFEEETDESLLEEEADED